MKVDKIEVYPLYVPLSESIPAPVSLPHAEKIENIVFGGYRATIVRIYTDEGLVGIGECMTRLSPLALKAIIDEIAPIGQARQRISLSQINQAISLFM